VDGMTDGEEVMENNCENPKSADMASSEELTAGRANAIISRLGGLVFNTKEAHALGFEGFPRHELADKLMAMTDIDEAIDLLSQYVPRETVLQCLERAWIR